MPITIREFEESLVPAVLAFNERLARGGVPYRFPTSPQPLWLPRRPEANLYQQYFLAVEGAAEVRGGYCIKHQDYRVGDSLRSIGQIALPLSEGSGRPDLCPRRRQVAPARHSPAALALCLGNGGPERVDYASGPGRGFARELPCPSIFAWSGPTPFCGMCGFCGTLPCGGLHSMPWPTPAWGGWPAREPILSFHAGAVAARADGRRGRRILALGRRLVAGCAADDYPYCAVRDAATLRSFIHKTIRGSFAWNQRGRPLIGWAVLLATDLTHRKQFGDMRLGSIVDAFARPADAERIIASAERFLISKQVDLIVSNQSHGVWSGALKKCGFLAGPSNFLLATSRKLTALLDTLKIANDRLHLNRGDGDGPINL